MYIEIYKLYFIRFSIKHTEIYIKKRYSQRASPWMKANPAIFGALTEKALQPVLHVQQLDLSFRGPLVDERRAEGQVETHAVMKSVLFY